MSTSVGDRILLDSRGCKAAFRIGQWIERLLLDRGMAAAAESGSSVVTVEHVESCLDHALFDELIKRMREDPNERTAEESGNHVRESQKAA